MTKFPDLFAALAAPFDTAEVKLRQAPGGRQLHYITARTAMNRLDSVLGPENWWDRFTPLENSVVCELSIRLPDGSTVTKCDAGGYAGMADQGDDDKSGFSDAFKRAAAKLGVARYLYRDGVPAFVTEREPAAAQPPAEPVAPARQTRPAQQAPANGQQQQGKYGPPKTGKGLFAWTKEQEQKHEVSLLKYLNNWGKIQEYPSRMVDWDTEQVELAYAEALRKLESMGAIPPSREEFDDSGLSNSPAPVGSALPAGAALPSPLSAAAVADQIDADTAIDPAIRSMIAHLWAQLTTIALYRTGKPEATEDDCLAACDSLPPPPAGMRRITDVLRARDPKVLAWYLTEAERRINGIEAEIAAERKRLAIPAT